MKNNATIQTLREQLLNAVKATKRAEAADELGEFGAEAAEAVGDLIAALEDKEERVSLRAAKALGELGKAAETAIPKLFEKVVSGDRTAFLASRSIALMEDAGVEFLLLQLSGPEVRRAVAAAYCLYGYGYLQTRIARPDLTQAVLHTVEDIAEGDFPQDLRNAAALVVGALLSNPSVQFDSQVDLNRANSRLFTHISQPRLNLALKCAVTLGEMGIAAVPSVPALIRAIVQDVWWQPYAVVSLKRIDQLAIGLGQDIFDSPEATSALGHCSKEEVRSNFKGYCESFSRERMEERARQAGATFGQDSHADGIEIVGVYRVKNRREPVFLIELIVLGSSGRFDIGEFGQNIAFPASQQVAYDERFLEADGTGELTNCDLTWPDEDTDERWIGNVRLAFFLHYLDFDQKLDTPFGSVALPEPVSRPKRLEFIRYSSPD